LENLFIEKRLEGQAACEFDRRYLQFFRYTSQPYGVMQRVTSNC